MPSQKETSLPTTISRGYVKLRGGICSTFGCVKTNLGFSSAYCFNPITTGPVIFDRYDGVTKKPLQQTDPMHPFWPPTEITRGKMPHICHKVGPLLVINGVITPISRVITPGKPIYKAI